MSQEPQEFPPAAGGASELRAEGRLLRNADPVRGEYIAPDGRITSAWWTQPTCYLETSAPVVAAGQPYWFKVTGSNLPSTARGYWFGTKNGVTDTSSVLAGAVPATFYSTNQPGWQGVYTRWMEIRDGNNRLVCVTNVVTMELAPAPTTCLLETSAPVVAAGQPYWYKVTGSNLPSTATGYWYGTKNGVTDHSTVLAGAVPATFHYTNLPGWQGVYTRWMEIRDGNNRVVCVTNTVTTELMPAPTTCLLETSASVVAAGQPFWFKVTGSNLPSTATGYWYGTKNGVTDTSSVLAGAVPATFPYTNQPGWQGVYTRWMEIRDGNNRVACVTNTMTMELK